MILYLNGQPVEMFDGIQKCQQIIISDINQLARFMSFSGHYAFRGHANVDWKLKTSFERFIEFNPTTRQLTDIEIKLINRFEQDGHQLLMQSGIDFQNLELGSCKSFCVNGFSVL